MDRSYMMKRFRGCGRPTGGGEVVDPNMAVSEMLRSENSDTFFLCADCQPGEAGSPLVAGDAGEAGDCSPETLSKTESLFVDRGELGADDGMNSPWPSSDQRVVPEPALIGGGDNRGPGSAPCWKRPDEATGDPGAEKTGGVNTPGVMPCLRVLAFRVSGLWATW